MWRSILIYLGLYLYISTVSAQPQPTEGVYGDKAMVVCAHPAAAAIGCDILQKGGNAFDAAVAVEFALAVCYPIAGNIGGGGFAVYRKANGEVGSLDYREKAPAQAQRDMYLKPNGEVDNDLSRNGHLAVGVPGTVAGMCELHARFGQLSFAEVLQPAIDLAEKGLLLTEREAAAFNRHQEEFKKYNRWKIPFIAPPNAAWQAGDTILQLELAEVLKRIQAEGKAGFYEGKTAELIVEEMQAGGGIISKADLANYRAKWRRPIVGEYRGHRIISMGPPSSGGIVLMQILGMIEKYDLKGLGWQQLPFLQLIIEAERRAYADRATYLGDSDFYPVPVDNLLDSKYLQNRMQDMSFEQATPSSAIKAGTFAPYESQETTHYSIVDAEGNALAATTTLNGAYGSKVMVKEGGFFLNNEMDDFSAKPGSPNMFGLVGGEANAIMPHKRMLSSMTPTIVTYKGRLKMVLGSPGGSTIITSVLQNIINVVDFGMTMQSAVNAGRFHHQWLPDKVFAEAHTFSKKQIKALEAKGYPVTIWQSIGKVDAILRHPDGRLEGAADPRGDDTALGY